MEYIDLKEIQRIETDMLSEIDEICKNNGLEYFLLCGSVLGAVRHGGPIPWDSDADIGVPIDELDLFLETVKNQISDKYYIEYCKYDSRSPALHPETFAKGIDERVLHVDVFPLFGIPESKDEQRSHWNEIRECMWDLHSKRFAFIGNHDDWTPKTMVKRVLHYVKCAIKYPSLDEPDVIINRFFELLKKYPFEGSKYSTFPCVGNSERAITETIFYGGPLLPMMGMNFVFQKNMMSI